MSVLRLLRIYGPAGPLLAALAAALFLLYAWMRYRFTYWRRRAVLGPPPTFPFGNVRAVLQRNMQFFQPYNDAYFAYRDLPYVGLYVCHVPVLCVNDADIARLILVKEFDSFTAHGIFTDGDEDPLSGHLFNLYGDRWRRLRTRMSPVFSPGKLKCMYPLVLSVARDAASHAERARLRTGAVNMSHLYDIYTMEIIASVGFGVECNGFKSKSEFYQRGHDYFAPKSTYWSLVRLIAFFAPKVSKKWRIRRIEPEITHFFTQLVSDTAAHRRQHGYRRNDFLQAMMELENEERNNNDDQNTNKGHFPFTMGDVAANAMLYLLAGYETSSTVGQFAAYELALNPTIQDKVRSEIVTVLAKHNGECSYEAQSEMTYMNMVFDETMRKYPPLRALFRRCNRDYKLPDHELVIEDGTLIFIPCQAIQMDPAIYPDPDKFDPDRFLPERKAARHPCHWMPFGEGPRKCLGLRQGYTQVKLALVMLLQQYQMQLDPRTPVPLTLSPRSLACSPATPIWIQLNKL